MEGELSNLLPSWLPLAALLVNGSPVSLAFTDRLLGMRITDGVGYENDSCEITVDDRDYLLPLLNPGDKIIPVLAYLPGGGMADLGVYTVESAKYNMLPRTWSIKAQAVDYINTQIGLERTVTYHDKTIKEVANEVGTRHGLKIVVDKALADKKVKHFNQQSQSDLDMLGEVARKYGAVVSIKNDEIIIKKPFNGKNILGITLTALNINYTEISGGNFSQTKRDDAEGVTASYMDDAQARRIKVTAGNTQKSRELKERFNDEEQAVAAANAALFRAQSFKRNLSFETVFNADLSAEIPINFIHPRAEISGAWVIEQRVHDFSRSGCTTSVECITPRDYAESLIEKHGISKDEKTAASDKVQKNNSQSGTNSNANSSGGQSSGGGSMASGGLDYSNGYGHAATK